MHKAIKGTLAVAAGVAVLSAAVSPALVSAWGDNGGGRRSYTEAQINNGDLGNKIVFNSISDGVIGDEKNFVGARENTGINAGKDNIWEGNNITVEDGKEYLVRLYVHNNNPNGLNAVARDTRVAFDIPEYSAKQIQVNGFITSSNATPSKYWDYVNFNSDRAFHLEYVYGSALLENNGIGQNGGVKLGDEIVTKAASENGVKIGYNALDGNVPGCYTYDNFVGIIVKAVFDDNFTINKEVRLAGTTEWSNTVNAQVGDKVEFQIEYQNTDRKNLTHNNVTIRDVLPNNMKYVAGSTILYNSNHPNGGAIKENTVTTTGINIGSYGKGANAYVRFTAEVVDNSLACGHNTLVNWARGTVNQTLIQDYATVTLSKVCEGKIPETGPEAITGGVIATGTIVTAAGYYIVSRRSLR